MKHKITTKNKKSVANNISEKILSLDKFGQTLNMEFDGGKTSVSTWTGTIMSLILSMILLAYTAQKI